MVENEGYNVVVVVGGDSVSSLNPREFVERADEAFASREVRQNISYLKSPYIPNAYAHCTTAHMQKHNVSREQLAMVSVLMSAQATYHPLAVQRRPYDLDEVLNSTTVGQNLNLLECARKADGAAAIVVTKKGNIKVVGGGEASSPALTVEDYQSTLSRISSAKHAFQRAYDSCNCSAKDIDFFGLYDCFPICFLRAVEASGLAKEGQGGQWIEDKFRIWNDCRSMKQRLSVKDFPVNTHGGLLSFGAPWEVPAFFALIEAFEQLSLTATEGGRQIPNCKRALVYGNGGVFNSSSVVVLSSS
mmetsp:Transcript_36109/g.112821  ORF Transcript_36109/g.112821 Transcript_36109/m.112821 type:complete len:302 (-) Transcript_36109:265-1170(-)